MLTLSLSVSKADYILFYSKLEKDVAKLDMFPRRNWKTGYNSLTITAYNYNLYTESTTKKISA